MRWLCIEAHFLAGWYHGRSDEGRAGEWPPNPHRLFQALVAASNLGFRRADFSDAKREALRWLERRLPPEIAVPEFKPAGSLRLYVPNNDMDKVARAWAKGAEPEKQPAELRTNKDLRPHAVSGDRTVRFLWPIDDAEWEAASPHAEILCAEARHLHALGLGIDLVAGNGRILSDADMRALPGALYRAEDGIGWRVPAEGALNDLVQRHAAQAERVRAGGGRGAARWVAPPGPPSAYREVAYRLGSLQRGRPFHAFALVDADGAFRSFDPRDAMEVAAWLRHAAHIAARALKLDSDFVEGFVCGHGGDAKNDRFSYLPLPTIPAKGRDGRIRRVLVAEPPGVAGATARSVVRRLGGASLVVEGTGEIKAELRALAGGGVDGVTTHYLGTARRWGSVTPMVLPGRDDRRSRKAHALVLKALAQAGCTTPVAEIHLQAEPVFPGAEMARRYRVPAYLKAYPLTHAIVTFAEPVTGPLAIGGGRHVGLGVLAAMVDGNESRA